MNGSKREGGRIKSPQEMAARRIRNHLDNLPQYLNMRANNLHQDMGQAEALLMDLAIVHAETGRAIELLEEQLGARITFPSQEMLAYVRSAAEDIYAHGTESAEFRPFLYKNPEEIQKQILDLLWMAVVESWPIEKIMQELHPNSSYSRFDGTHLRDAQRLARIASSSVFDIDEGQSKNELKK